MVLLACPFCRELFERRERRTCAVCGVALVPLDRLAPSGEEQDDLPQPEHDPLPLTSLGRGRGPLALLAVLGLFAFAGPWVNLTLPDIVTYTGADLARRIGWVWAAGVAWFVLVPVVVTRCSIAQMRGARVAAAFLSAIPGLTAALLWARPPHASHGVPLRFAFGVGLYATVGLSLAALAFALSFGGRTDDMSVRRGSSAGEVLH